LPINVLNEKSPFLIEPIIKVNNLEELSIKGFKKLLSIGINFNTPIAKLF
jgi:hypothetical protein